jgi:hypothetical protein
MRKSQRRLFVTTLLAGIVGLPLVSAAHSGLAGLDKAIEVMSSLFYPSILLRNETVQVGFFKFLFFLLIFATINWALTNFVFKKGGDANTNKRASGVAAFAISAISAFFMPVKMALATGGFITGIFTLLLPLALIGVIIYLAFAKFKDTWWQHLLGLSLLILGIILMQWLLGVIA